MPQIRQNPDQPFAHEYDFTDHQKERQDESCHDRDVQFDVHQFPFLMLIAKRNGRAGLFLWQIS
jgi:hypothetical protein